MATAVKSKKRAEDNADRDQAEAIEQLLGLSVGGKSIRQKIREQGSRDAARRILASEARETYRPRFAGEWWLRADEAGFVFAADETCLDDPPGGALWDEVIDEAIDADAGAEWWIIPKDDPPPHGGVSTSTPGGIEVLGRADKNVSGPRIEKSPFDAFAPTDDEPLVATANGFVSGKGARLPNGKPANARRGKEKTASPAAAQDSGLATQDSPAANHESPTTNHEPRPTSHGAAVAISVSPDLVDPNPWQPRREFAQAELDELAASLASHGLIQAITVRPHPDTPAKGKPRRYQLVDGERRLRAARQAKLAEIPALVRNVSDEQMAEMALVANDQRQDLNPIERAEAYRRALTERGWTQQQLGERLKRSQAYVAKAVRLLELPEPWRSQIISRRMSESHGKELLRVAKWPAALKYLEERMRDELAGKEEFEALAAFRQDVDWAVRDTAQPVGSGARRTYYCRKRCRDIPVFTPTDEQRRELEIVELDDQPWAMNVALWKKLQKAHEKTLPASATEPAAWMQRSAAKKKHAGGKSEPRKVDTFNRDVEELRDNWRKWLIAGELERRPASDVIFQRLLLASLCNCDDISLYVGNDKIAKFLGVKGDGRYVDGVGPMTRAALKLDACGCAKLAKQFAVESMGYSAKTGPEWRQVDPEAVAVLLEALAIDPLEAWRKNFCGPMTDAFFKLHSKERLETLAGELGVFVPPGRTREQIVKLIKASAAAKQRLPASLMLPKPESNEPKAKAKKKGAKS